MSSRKGNGGRANLRCDSRGSLTFVLFSFCKHVFVAGESNLGCAIKSIAQEINLQEERSLMCCARQTNKPTAPETAIGCKRHTLLSAALRCALVILHELGYFEVQQCEQACRHPASTRAVCTLRCLAASPGTL